MSFFEEGCQDARKCECNGFLLKGKSFITSTTSRTMSGNCKGVTDIDQCTDVACSWNANIDGGKCLCKVGYGSAKGDASDCAPCEGNTVNTVNGTKEACTVCNGENQVAGKTGSGAGNDVCQCKAGYGLTDGSCVKCEGTKYKKDAGNDACSNCTGTGATGLPASATSDGNTICGCDAGYSGANGTGSNPGQVTCTACVNDTYTGAAGKDKCDPCGDKKIGVPASGDISKNTTGPNTQCIAAGSSSASPLAILIICSLIISIIASIATAAVMIRRKANNARTAEAIVSDAL